MNLAEISLRNRVVTLVLTAALLGGGIQSYQGLSRLEDPEFTIKEALVTTAYPGASAAEVEEEVTDRIEQAVQQLGQLNKVESQSYRGLSIVSAEVKDQYDKTKLPQVWDELRRKVGDVQGKLPPGAGPSIVNDDYGDVFGVFVAVYGEEYTYAELKDVVDLLRRELLLVDDVAKIVTFGERPEVIYVEMNRDRLSQLGISPDTIIRELRRKNVVADAGRVQVGPEYIAIEPTGDLSSVRAFESILISGQSDRQIYLKDVADVRRGYVEPPGALIRYDGQPAIGLGISTVSGGNVVTMGEGIERRADELRRQIPLGIEVGIISLQSEAVTVAIDGFLESLVQAVVIVVVVLLFFMGLRSGLLIGAILVITICGTFIFMGPWNIALERISLGALIIALGMLVDNAIVVVDGMLVKIENGVEPERAASEVVSQQAMPLLGATAVAIMAFGAIGLSEDSTGEFCRSLFQVVFLSLSLSWVTAMTTTPVLCVMFLKVPEGGSSDADPYAGGFYGAYRGFLSRCIRMRWLTVSVVLGLFAASLWGFQYVDQSFFPPSTRPQFKLDFWLPEGTYIDDTARTAAEVEEYLLEQEEVTHVTSLIGQGGLRFLLTYTPEKANGAYVQFLVDVADAKAIDGLIDRIETDLGARYEDAVVFGLKFELGPGEPGKIRPRISGPDIAVLRDLAQQALEILHEDPVTKGVRTNWRQKVKVSVPHIAEEQANLAGVQRTAVGDALLEGFEGATVGVYREGDLLLPIILRAPQALRGDIASMKGLQVWSPSALRYIPLRQVVSRFDTEFEDSQIHRYDRKRTIEVYADAKTGTASVVFDRVKPKIEAIEFPPGYELVWGGEYEDSGKAQAGIAASIPAFFAGMVLIVIMLFNSLRQPAIIWLTVPLAVIGVTTGLLVTGQPFGFMALLGFMSLSGMLIKNAIVLIDQIRLESETKELLPAILDSGVSRLRPVGMAASTTALGMIPLVFDDFFVAMAVTIIFGLVFATLLTMIVVPVLYAIFYGAASE